MIAAHKIPWFNFLVRRRLAAVMRKRFHNVYVLGAEHLRALDPARPVVGCVNHTNWWDGFVLYVLSHRRLPHDIYLAMEEKNLSRYRFFTWMGVFGVDLGDPRAALGGMRYALRLLRRRTDTPRLIWIFVQGRLLHPEVPITVKPGALFLARHGGAQILPVILRYEWQEESRPSIFVQFGAPMPAETSPKELPNVMNHLFVQTGKALDPGAGINWEPIFPERRSIHTRWDAVLRVLLHASKVSDIQND